jgi:LacI family transcriptional regulator
MPSDLKKLLPKAQRIKEELKAEMQDGIFGESGSPFLTTRGLCEYKNISLRTAHRIVNMLKDEGFLKLQGKRHFIEFEATASSRAEDNKLIGFLVTNLENPFFAGLAGHIQDFAREAGYELIIAASGYDARQEREQLEMFCRQGVAGILSCPWGTGENEQYYRSLPVPFALIGRKLKTLDADAVLVNNNLAAQSVADHLISEGFESFAYIGPTGLQRDPRLAGFRSSLMEHGYELPEENILQLNNSDAEIDINKIAKFIAQTCSSRTGIFCFHDLFAVRTLNVCHSMGIAVPQQIGLVGFDNLPVASEVFPQLTSISYPVKDMAQIAFEVLLGKIGQEDNSGGITRYLESKLIVRKSSKKDAESNFYSIPSGCLQYQVS